MGLPALRHDPQYEKVAKKPSLSVVQPQARPRQSRRSIAISRESVRRTYVSFVIVVSVVALLGMGRVWLSASAAQASIDSSKLQSQIKVAKNEGDMLEVQKSSLATPARIKAIASSAMGMTSATSLSYLDLASVPQAAAETPRVASSGGTFSRMLAKAMSVAAGEAQQLLVGDVGLASE